ncbi:MAG: MFS transporter [Armatimonadota bacterium]
MSGHSSGRSGAAVGAQLSAMMFLQFFVWGAWYVTVGNFMTANGMGDGVAWAYSVAPIAAIISPFFLGMVADRFFATERVLGVLHLLGGLILLAAPMVAQGGAAAQTTFIVVLLLYALCYMPTLGLTNTLAFHNVTDQERQFPMIRVFGTIGWIAANIVVSKLLKGDTTAVQFYVAGGASLVLGLYSFVLPHTPPPAAGRAVTARDVLGLDSLALMRSPAFSIFIVSSFLICIPLAAYYSFAPIYVGTGFADPAFNMSFGQMSEIFFMLVMPLCFARLGVKYMLVVGMLAWVLRYGLFAAAAPTFGMSSAGLTPAHWMVLGGIVLHGICYDFFFVTGQIYVDKRAPAAIRGQAQGFLVLVTQGLGMLIGAQLTGKIKEAYTQGDVVNWQSLWMIAAIAAGVVMVAFFALFRDDSKAAEPVPPAGTAPVGAE